MSRPVSDPYGASSDQAAREASSGLPVRAFPDQVRDWMDDASPALGRFAVAVGRLTSESDAAELLAIRGELHSVGVWFATNPCGVARVDIARRALRDSCWRYMTAAKLKREQSFAAYRREIANGVKSYEQFKSDLELYASHFVVAVN